MNSKFFKKSLSIFMCLILLAHSLALIGCDLGGVDPSDATPGEATPGEATPSDTPEGENGELTDDAVFIMLDTVCDNAVISSNIILTSPNREITLPVPERESFRFVGWYKDENYTEPVNDGDTFSQNATLYAMWEYQPEDLSGISSPATVEYIVLGGDIPSLPHLAEVYESGSRITLPTPQRDGFIFKGWYTDRACTSRFSSSTVVDSIRLFAKWTYIHQVEGMTLPIISISTESKKPISSRDYYIDCNVTVGDNSSGYAIKSASARVRGRGNSTWTQFSKKSYRLKFDESTDLMGFGKAKDFLLISNAFDMSQMRNYTAYTLAGLFGDDVTTKCDFAHLFVNGEYLGLYLITEHTEEGKNRVDIGDGSEGGVDVGYLIEFGGEIIPEGKKTFTLKDIPEYSGDGKWLNGKIGKIKSPDENICTENQRAYIEDYVNRVHKAILTKDFDSFSELCDVESFLNCFVINEVLFPCDWGYNFFMYKPAGDKLYMGPLWDYDQSAGNSTHGGAAYDQNAGVTNESDTEKNGWSAPSDHHWFNALKDTPEFFELARQHYIDNYELLHSLPDIIYGKYNEISTDIALNFERWDVIGRPHWRALDILLEFKTQKEHVDYYVNWLKGRMAWLEANDQFNIKKNDLQ